MAVLRANGDSGGSTAVKQASTDEVVLESLQNVDRSKSLLILPLHKLNEESHSEEDKISSSEHELEIEEISDYGDDEATQEFTAAFGFVDQQA